MDDSPKTTSAIPVDCSDQTREEKVMTSPGLRVMLTGSTAAGDEVCTDNATVCEPSATADAGVGVPGGSCVDP